MQLPVPPHTLADLQQIDQLVNERIAARTIVRTTTVQHVPPAGGQPLRAALCVTAAQLLGQYDREHTRHAAAAVELIHAASLVHEHLIDGTSRGRGPKTEPARWDHGVPLMVGDYLFALAAGEMARSPDARVIGYYSQAVMRICESELAPVTVVQPLDAALEQYYFRIGGKTAALFAAACRAGMALGGGDAAQIEMLAQYGYELGLAFQIAADAREYLGSPPGLYSWRAGMITLPLIYAVEASGSELLALFEHPGDEAQLASIAARVQQLRAPARAHEHAARHAATARAMLAVLPDSSARQTLDALTEVVVAG